jgi:two-component system cell cycle sensor histidine kinase/response regulator CckA
MTFKKKSSAKNEFITIAIVAVLFLSLAIEFKLFDKFFSFIVRFRDYHLDEIVLMITFLSFLFALFSYRRWKELDDEITEHTKSEQARKQTEQRSEALLTTLPNLTFRIKRDGTFLDFRAPSPEDRFDSAENIIGKTVTEHFPEIVAAQYMAHIESALTTNTIQTFEYELHINGLLKKFQARIIASGADEVFVLIRNITDSEIISEALARSETRFRAVVESLSEGLMLTDLEDRVLYMNQRMSELCGWDIEEVRDTPTYSFLIPKDKHVLHLERNRRRAQGFAERYEMEMLRKDGTTFWAEVYGSPFRDTKKRIIGTIGTITDITEQKWNERLQSALYRIASLARSSHDMQELFSTIHAAIGELMYAKNFYIALYDPFSNMISFPYFVDEIDDPPLPRKFSHGSTEYVLTTGNILHAPQSVFEEMANRGDVDPIGADAVDWLGIPLKSGNTTFGVLVVQSYDPKITFTNREKEILVFVSQQIATAIQQHSEEERFRAIWEHSADGMRVTDKNGRIVMVNDAYCRMVKKTKEELINEPFSIVYHRTASEQLTGLEEYKKRFATDTMIPKLDEQVTLWNNETLMVEMTASYITYGINERMLLCAFRDVTERKKLEEQLLHAQKMDSIGVLAGGIAHDFNNVLAMILGSAELVKNRAKEYPEIMKFANMIANAAERGSGIAKQLLMFARTEKGLHRPVSLSAIVNDVCKLLEHSIPKSISIQTALYTENDVIMGDEDQLHQILINLAVNAKDAIEQKGSSGTITFSITNVDGDELKKRLPQAQNGLFVVLNVEDNGKGMTEQTLTRAFEPFFSTKERGKGTGLGLSIVHGIMKNHGGLIDVESTADVGTTFHLYFPASHVIEVQKQHPTVESSTGALQNGTSKNILIVDDEVELSTMMKDILETHGHFVIIAHNGIEALNIYDQEKKNIDLIISDLGMPVMNGRQLLTTLRQKGSSVRFILITGYMDQGSKQDLLNEGANDVLLKPFTTESVLAAVNRAVSR